MNLAPLKTYLIPLAVLNIARQLLVPPSEVGDAVSVALFAATAATVFLVVTGIHRLASTRRGPHGSWGERHA